MNLVTSASLNLNKRPNKKPKTKPKQIENNGSTYDDRNKIRAVKDDHVHVIRSTQHEQTAHRQYTYVPTVRGRESGRKHVQTSTVRAGVTTSGRTHELKY